MNLSTFLKEAQRHLLPVRKDWLHFTTGAMCSGAGIILWTFAYRWLKSLSPTLTFVLTIAGILLAALIYSVGFSKLSKKNIHRIMDLPGKKSTIFNFQKWSSYPLVAFMISLGIYLRKYSSLPKPLLGALYIGIGGGFIFIHLWDKHKVAKANKGKSRKEE